MPLLDLKRPRPLRRPASRLGTGALVVSFDGGVTGNGRKDATGTWGVSATLGGRNVWTGGGPVEGRGKVTNNVAEFEGLVRALRWVKERSPSAAGSAVVKGDSQFVVRAVQGRYTVRKEHLLPLVQECRDLLADCQDKFPVVLKWVPREENQEADRAAARARLGFNAAPPPPLVAVEVEEDEDDAPPVFVPRPEFVGPAPPGSAEEALNTFLERALARCSVRRDDRVKVRTKVTELRRVLEMADAVAGRRG